MSGGTKTQTTNQTQKSDPWAPAQPGLQNILTGAQSAYDSGVGSQVYGGQRVAGLGDTTQAGLADMTANAGAATASAQNANTFLQGLLGNGGTTTDIQSALQGLLGVGTADTSGVASAAARMGDPNNAASTVGRGLVGGDYNLDATGYQGLLSGLGNGTQTQRSLQAAANGDYLGGANPYLDKIIAQGSGDAASQIAQQFAASGRYGSGRFAGAVADAVDRVGTQARYTDYDAERTRQAQAASAIDAATNARTGVQSGLLGAINDVKTSNAGQAVTGANLASGADAAALTGANALANLQSANNAQRLQQQGAALSSAQGDRAAAQSGLGQIGTVQQGLLAPGQTLAGIGAIQDAARQQQLDSNQAVFDEGQQQQWKQLGLLSSLVNPIAGLGGTSTGQSVQKIPQAGLLQQLFGAGLAGAGVASKFL